MTHLNLILASAIQWQFLDCWIFSYLCLFFGLFYNEKKGQVLFFKCRKMSSYSSYIGISKYFEDSSSVSFGRDFDAGELYHIEALLQSDKPEGERAAFSKRTSRRVFLICVASDRRPWLRRGPYLAVSFILVHTRSFSHSLRGIFCYPQTRQRIWVSYSLIVLFGGESISERL